MFFSGNHCVRAISFPRLPRQGIPSLSGGLKVIENRHSLWNYLIKLDSGRTDHWSVHFALFPEGQSTPLL